MSVPIIEYDKDKGLWIDQYGKEYATSTAEIPDGPGLGAIVVAARWEKILRLAGGSLEERTALLGAVQAKCGGCADILGLSAATQEKLNQLRSAAILCHVCYEQLKEFNRKRGGA